MTIEYKNHAIADNEVSENAETHEEQAAPKARRQRNASIRQLRKTSGHLETALEAAAEFVTDIVTIDKILDAPADGADDKDPEDMVFVPLPRFAQWWDKATDEPITEPLHKLREIAEHQLMGLDIDPTLERALFTAVGAEVELEAAAIRLKREREAAKKEAATPDISDLLNF